MAIKSKNIEQFQAYSQFQSLKEFNSHMEQWLVEYKKDFTKSELLGLKRLVRFAAKVPGVSNAKIGTVLKAIHTEYQEKGISRSTFKRMLGKAKRLGIITILETERRNGSQSSNLYVFNRVPQHEPPKLKKLTPLNKTNNLSKTKKQDITKRNENTPVLDHTYTSDRVPKDFVAIVKCYFDNAKTIEEYWKMTRIISYRNNREKESDTVLDLAIHSFKQFIRKLKLDKVKNPIGYYCGILNNKLTELYFEELWEMELE